jgi:quercetin dioxygenase-like cupin family protein/DNA-binding XRE family transcriptional regulator
VRQLGYLEVNMTNSQNDIQSQLNSFGARLRELRQQRGWTLQDLASRSSLSKTFLSRLESGDRQASISAVLTLSRIFDVSLDLLFETPLATDPCVIVRGATAPERTANGLTYVPLSDASRFFNVQPIRVRVSPTRRGKEHYHHEGEEWLYVLSGALTLSLAGGSYDLDQGDAAHFDSRLPHRLIARGPGDAEVLLVAARLTGATPVAQSAFRQYRAIPTPGLTGPKAQLKLPRPPRRARPQTNFPVPTANPHPPNPPDMK